jgi:hypothetical protein
MRTPFPRGDGADLDDCRRLGAARPAFQFHTNAIRTRVRAGLLNHRQIKLMRAGRTGVGDARGPPCAQSIITDSDGSRDARDHFVTSNHARKTQDHVFVSNERRRLGLRSHWREKPTLRGPSARRLRLKRVCGARRDRSDSAAPFRSGKDGSPHADDGCVTHLAQQENLRQRRRSVHRDDPK